MLYRWARTEALAHDCRRVRRLRALRETSTPREIDSVGMKKHTPSDPEDKKRELQAELSQLVRKVKATIDTEEAALVRMREILQMLDEINGVPETPSADPPANPP
jgi:hypothetical protein